MQSNLEVQCNSFQDSDDILHRAKANIKKIYIESQKALHSNSDPEKKEQSGRNHVT